eukprot:3412397-Rhodomonas_salina.2
MDPGQRHETQACGSLHSSVRTGRRIQYHAHREWRRTNPRRDVWDGGKADASRKRRSMGEAETGRGKRVRGEKKGQEEHAGWREEGREGERMGQREDERGREGGRARGKRAREGEGRDEEASGDVADAASALRVSLSALA